MFCSALEPLGEEVQVVTVPEGGSVELPCMRGVYPSPDNIKWWRNDTNCDLLQCLVSIHYTCIHIHSYRLHGNWLLYYN